MVIIHPHWWKLVKEIKNYRLDSAGLTGHYKKYKCRFCSAGRVKMTGEFP